jgi:phage virion morphogenesis protein
MAGASITVDVDDREVMAMLNRLAHAAGDLKPAFHDIGEYLKISHRERFDRQESPDGQSWAPLDPKYQARKKKNADKILVLEGLLRDLLAYNVKADELEFGTNLVYGATHQFGRPEAGIPARPFLGFSDDDRAEILEILTVHLALAL